MNNKINIKQRRYKQILFPNKIKKAIKKSKNKEKIIKYLEHLINFPISFIETCVEFSIFLRVDTKSISKFSLSKLFRNF